MFGFNFTNRQLNRVKSAGIKREDTLFGTSESRATQVVVAFVAATMLLNTVFIPLGMMQSRAVHEAQRISVSKIK